MARIAIVTGGTRGIGEAISLALKAEGAVVVANYGGDDKNAAEFSERTSIASVKWNVANSQACLDAVGNIEASYGAVDIVINNAGINCDATLLKMTYEMWSEVLDVNLGGCFNMAKAAFPGMRQRKFGRIVSIGSMNGQAGQYGQVNYAAAKSGIHGFTKSLAQEGGRAGVTVNAICPGYIDTSITATLSASDRVEMGASVPVGRLGRGSDIARAVVFLTRDDAGFVTGSTLSINGGQHMY